MSSSANLKTLSMDEIKSSVGSFAVHHLDVNWRQNTNKIRFFLIFRQAYANKLCGEPAQGRLNSARKKKKSVKVADYVLSKESLAQLLNEVLRNVNDHDEERKTELISDLTMWWHEWTFAWDKAEKPVSRPRKISSARAE